MTNTPKISPFRLLQQLEQRGHEHGAELPAQEEVHEEWVGVAFRLGGAVYLAPMSDVTEILTCPQLSQVPRTKPWLKGLANVRGTLLPVMDLNGYLGRQSSALTRLSRVLVIRCEESMAGLLVDEVLGMRHFERNEWRALNQNADDAVQPYLDGAFEHDGESWPVFSMRALANHPLFLKVAS
ncbi:hypothetical protein CAI21_00740 [Alkalilimnicola ehrlichii]|uniref:CheW-like domain-containing protein n=1 Tax=Alkalilimnicola ehrlichii TaxID=351052 RepID=A0A3E0X391_9GAMM|nr:chemotaxis protein CheW [Alkalilimnicola ehrlichii]RFA31211.1 hypothetical protein CAI21_00740 [Alkalilimnicola ehrlichii]RFA39508.1 hypothetical protein CAL65_01670 [Alkalilimnicola ehrlichii]